MRKLSISLLGRDGPGVVATASLGMAERDCNILQVTQTILGAEFAAIYIVEAPDGLPIPELQSHLEAALERDGFDMSVLIRRASEGSWSAATAFQPYVVVVDGPDRPGLLGAMARVFARHGANIDNLKAVDRGAAGRILFVFEVQVPEGGDPARLSRELRSEARALGLEVSMQHRDIFEAMHRVAEL